MNLRLQQGQIPAHLLKFFRKVSLKPKDLCLVPERCALALQADGWYVRAKPCWIKNSSMPESTNDRPNVAHETIWMLTKQAKYYFDMEAVRVPSAKSTLGRDRYSRVAGEGAKGSNNTPKYAVKHDHEHSSDPAGRHWRTNDPFNASLDAAIEHHEERLAHLRAIRAKGGLLLSEDGDPLALAVNTESYPGAHYATWPTRLVRPMILSSTSVHCCGACGAPWVRVVENIRSPVAETFCPKTKAKIELGHHSDRTGLAQPGWRKKPRASSETLGWCPGCSCRDAPVVPCRVLDPFSGAATTVLVAAQLGRLGIGLDLNAAYIADGRRRIAEAMRPASRLDPPRRAAPDLPGQMNLFAEERS